jgi:hypothetical protein
MGITQDEALALFDENGFGQNSDLVLENVRTDFYGDSANPLALEQTVTGLQVGKTYRSGKRPGKATLK